MAFDLMLQDPLRSLGRLLNARAALLFAGLLATAAVGGTAAMVSVWGDDAKPDAGDRQRVIEGVVRNLKEHYVDRDIAQKMADVLLAREKNGDDKATTDGVAFADLLTRQLREASHDIHLEVVYSQDRLPDHPGAPSPEDLANYRRALEHENCTFESVKILPHNIGYLKLNSFPDVSICRSKAATAMASLNHADAIIFDLRDNRGGYPEMVMLISAYLFDHPEYMYNPRESPTERSWTGSPVAGNQLADKPAYVLISRTTWSGAEQFSYDLKMLKRATLVGERTRGGAHAGVFYRIDDHYGIGIPEVKAVNPFSKADWEGVGVEPDVKVKAADALETADRLAVSRLRSNR
jgi:peptidase S41-like protein